MARITKQQLLNKDDIEKRDSARKVKTINGRRLSSDSSFYAVEKGTQILKDAGFAKFQNTEMPENDCAISLLNALDISLISRDKSFSLLNTQTDQTEIDIDTGNMREIKNSKSDPDDKFPNSNDPFYDLDQQPEILIQQKRKQLLQMNTPNLVGLMADMVNINTVPGSSRLKQFTVAAIEIAQRDNMKYNYRTNMPAPVRGKGNPSITAIYEEDTSATAGLSASDVSKVGAGMQGESRPQDRRPKNALKGY